MCKVFAMPHINRSEVINAWKLVGAVTPFLSENDKDGLGYAAITRTGNLFGERWLNPKQAFKYTGGASDMTNRLMELVPGCLTSVEYSNFGRNEKQNAIGVILHARMATCEKSLKNVHPFVRENFALIHNGIVKGNRDTYQVTSTCDSELILNSYLDNEAHLNLNNIDKMMAQFSGYQAVATLGKDETGYVFMDIWRDNTASLYSIKVNKLKFPVFCTKAEIVRQACSELGWKVQAVAEVKAHTAMRFDCIKGSLHTKHDIDPSAKWSEYSYGTTGSVRTDYYKSEYDYEKDYDSYWDKKDRELKEQEEKRESERSQVLKLIEASGGKVRQ